MLRRAAVPPLRIRRTPHDALLPLLTFLSLFPHGNPNPSSRTGRHGAVAVRRASPPLEATPEQADAARSSASSSSPSPPKESSRGARNRRRRPVPPRSGRRRPSTVSSPSGLPGPCRHLQRTPGEHPVLRDTLLLPLSLSSPLPPCAAVRRRGHGRRRPSGDHLVHYRRSPNSPPSPLASSATARVQFRAKTTNS